MRRTVVNKAYWLFLLCFCFFSIACGQSEREKQRLVTEYEKKAYDLRMQGKNEEGLKEQLKAVELNPNDTESLLILTGIYLDLENWLEAVETAKKAVELAPNNSKTHYQLAVALERIGGDKQGVLKSFREAVRLAPNDTNALINLGTAYEDINDKQSARRYYEKALEIDSNYIPAIYLLGELDAEDGKIEKAIELFKKAVEIKIPENRMAEQSGSQRDAKGRMQELTEQKKNSSQKKP